jgi:hypothetical protein
MIFFRFVNREFSLLFIGFKVFELAVYINSGINVVEGNDGSDSEYSGADPSRGRFELRFDL